MPGIDPEIIMHKLQVDPQFPPVRQKRRKFAPERHEIINNEIKNLLGAGFIREVQYPEWLANVVVVKKKNGKWRVCIDFTDLNKSCPKDPFPLPHIDKLVDTAAGHQLMSFMDAFSGYNCWRKIFHEEITPASRFLPPGSRTQTSESPLKGPQELPSGTTLGNYSFELPSGTTLCSRQRGKLPL